MQKLKIIILLAVFMPFLAVMPVFSQEIKKGEQFEVSVFLNAESEAINAVEGKVVFPADVLELKEIRDGNSIINFWVERPKNNGNQIIFSGIIPGGYQEANGHIFSVAFQARQDGTSTIEIRDAKILLNDGNGTPSKTAIFNFQFSIFKPALDNDTDLPEDFKPEIASDPSIFEGKWFLVFGTQDKGLGIGHYEAQENKKNKIGGEKWLAVESPFLLKDQELKSFIFVKVIDKAGNERIVVVEPRYPIRWYGQPLIWSIIILGIIILYIVKKTLWKK